MRDTVSLFFLIKENRERLLYLYLLLDAKPFLKQGLTNSVGTSITVVWFLADLYQMLLYFSVRNKCNDALFR